MGAGGHIAAFAGAGVSLCTSSELAAAALTGGAPAAGSALSAWFARAQARESVASTFQESTAAIAGFQSLPEVVASGQFKREYRDHRLEWMLRSGGVEIVLEGLRKDNIRFSRELE